MEVILKRLEDKSKCLALLLGSHVQNDEKDRLIEQLTEECEVLRACVESGQTELELSCA